MSHAAPTPPHDCAGDAAAYVLGALEPDELEAFRAHLETCAICRDEVAALEDVVDVLPLAAPQYRAPHRMRRRVLRAARHEPPAAAVQAQRESRRWPWASLPQFGGPRLAYGGLGLGLAIALAALIIAISGSGPGSGRLLRAQVVGRGSADVRVLGGHAELILEHFPAPPAGEIYEVWLQHGTRTPSPTGTLFATTSQGSAAVGVTASLRGVSRLMVTAEPAGGTEVPTTAPVIIARLD